MIRNPIPWANGAKCAVAIKTRGQQREWFERTLDVHQRICGQRPRGYHAPVYNIAQDVVGLMIEHGMGDDIPYQRQTKQGALYEMPVHWGTDDWPPFAHSGI